MQLLSLLLTCSTALAFAIPQDQAATPAGGSNPGDSAADALQNVDPSSFVPEGVADLIPGQNSGSQDSSAAAPAGGQSSPLDSATDALNNADPSSLVPEGVADLIPGQNSGSQDSSAAAPADGQSSPLDSVTDALKNIDPSKLLPEGIANLGSNSQDSGAAANAPNSAVDDPLQNIDPSKFLPNGLGDLIPDSITINQDNRTPPPPPPPTTQLQPWQLVWQQPSWTPVAPQGWFQPVPAPQAPGFCQNRFPNGIFPAVGPTDCAQIVDPWCNPTGQGYVCSPNYDYVVQCYGGRAYAVEEFCQYTLSCLAGIYGAYGGCLVG